MNATCRIAAGIVVSLLFWSSAAQGRAVRLLTFDELGKQADLVALLIPLKNEDVTSETPAQFCQGVKTTFTIICTLKGTAPGATLFVQHLVYKKFWPPNGGNMIDFPIEAPTTRQGSYVNNFRQHAWLAFLKRGANGAFVPAAGQQDPDESFFMVDGVPFGFSKPR